MLWHKKLLWSDEEVQRLPHVRLGRTILFPKEELDRHLKATLVQPIAQASRTTRRRRGKGKKVAREPVSTPILPITRS